MNNEPTKGAKSRQSNFKKMVQIKDKNYLAVRNAELTRSRKS